MEGKERMEEKELADRFQSHVALTLRLVNSSKYCGSYNPERIEAKKEGRKEQFEGDSWFGSATTAEQIALQGHEFVGPVSKST